MKGEQKFKPIDNFQDFFSQIDVTQYDLANNVFILKVNPHLEFKFIFDFSFLEELSIHLTKKGVEILNMKNSHLTFQFNYGIFREDFKFLEDTSFHFLFEKCTFQKSFNAPDLQLSGKYKFRNCEFNSINFYNTTFTDLLDFWSCEFTSKIIFLKTDFLGTTVFSGSTFEENVLFTYCLIDKLVIFRGTEFKKGLDLSLSIGNGHLNFFDIHLEDFKAETIIIKDKKSYNEIYDKLVTTTGEIPLKNKRETFRIIKQILVSQSNISESIKYKVLEKETLRKELKEKKPPESKNSWYKKVLFYSEVFLDRSNLWLNKNSNFYGKSFGRALIFTMIFGGIFFYLSAINSNAFDFYLSYEFSADVFFTGLGYFIQFLLPTHRFDYMGGVENVSVLFFIFDFIGRLFVGYGIYQFIQAFRKYK